MSVHHFPAPPALAPAAGPLRGGAEPPTCWMIVRPCGEALAATLAAPNAAHAWQAFGAEGPAIAHYQRLGYRAVAFAAVPHSQWRQARLSVAHIDELTAAARDLLAHANAVELSISASIRTLEKPIARTGCIALIDRRPFEAAIERLSSLIAGIGR